VTKTQPFCLLLSTVRWNLFCTLTVRGGAPSHALLSRSADSWLRWVAHISGKRFGRLLFVLRYEHGELGKRLHLHALMCLPENVLSYFVVPPPYVCAAHRRWGIGMTSFRLITDYADPALAYCLKETNGADNYEIGKTGSANSAVVSSAAWRVAKRSLRATAPLASIPSGETALEHAQTAGLRDRKTGPYGLGVPPGACVPSEVSRVGRCSGRNPVSR